MTAFAALIGINWREEGGDSQRVLWTVFEGSERHPDPIASCKALRASIEDDWPHHEQHIVANTEARTLHGDALVRAWLGDEEMPVFEVQR